MSTLGQGRILFLCDRAASDPAVGQVALELGCELVRARNLDDALAHAAGGAFALVLAGYSGDAGATLRSVRELRARLPHTPVIVHGIPRDPPFALETVYELGALAVLHDPVSAPILRSKASFFLDSYFNAAARRRNEEELQRLADDLAEQDRLKTTFLATLAHELRNPLAPIRSGLQLMRRAHADPATVARVQDIMDRQLDQLVHLVDDLLDVARITRGQIELKPDLIDLGEVLAAAVETSMPLIEAARHRLDLRLPAEALPLYADRTRITQVIGNLLNNAAKYTPRGGAIVLSAERDGEHAVIAVADDGIGIPAQSLDAVFTMFTQVPEHARQAPGGLGIGLSLVRSLLDLHGGSISAASGGQNAGSVFTVRLPLASGAEAAAAALLQQDAATAPPSPGRRLLVVDDNRDAAETLAALLATLGHRVAVANDGAQALRMLPGLAPQAVFLDIGMPGMSGYEVARAVRADAALDGVRLVALTGWGGEADRARTGAAGFDHHLTKPATLDALNAVLAGLNLPVER